MHTTHRVKTTASELEHGNDDYGHKRSWFIVLPTPLLFASVM